MLRDFYPRPPRGGRPRPVRPLRVRPGFLSTPSARRATFILPTILREALEFLSTPSARRATPSNSAHHGSLIISIHALREEGDPPAPRWSVYRHPFLSTPSARRATVKALDIATDDENFYPRPPRGGRRQVDFATVPCLLFLSTPSARRATPQFPASRRSSTYFYPRPPRGGRQLLENIRKMCGGISIHALREEGDNCQRRQGPPYSYFYPRPPRGGRRLLKTQNYLDINFYPRPPRGGRHSGQQAGTDSKKISIHALREEGDQAVPQAGGQQQ